jgi:hypothetical protein
VAPSGTRRDRLLRRRDTRRSTALIGIPPSPSRAPTDQGGFYPRVLVGNGLLALGQIGWQLSCTGDRFALYAKSREPHCPDYSARGIKR